MALTGCTIIQTALLTSDCHTGLNTKHWNFCFEFESNILFEVETGVTFFINEGPLLFSNVLLCLL